jgi:catechol 2,3-dioxygenase-like lactoylglutathione lyase family enzyme
MTAFLHTMVRITDPERSRAFYEALGFTLARDMDIVRNGELEATNYFFSAVRRSRPTPGARPSVKPNSFGSKPNSSGPGSSTKTRSRRLRLP